MPESSETLHGKIRAAQSVGGVPPGEAPLPSKTVGDLLARRADTYEEKPYLIFYAEDGHRREIGYRDLYESASRTAAYLAACGIRRGDRVATVSPNHADVVVQYFGAFLLGAVVVPVNTGEDDRRLTFILRSSRAKLAFVRQEHIARILALRAELPDLATVVRSSDTPDPAHPFFTAEIARQNPGFRPPSPVEPSDEALIVYTSGTTGNPKGVVLTQGNLLVDAAAIAEWHQIADDQRMMCVLPIHHVNGTVVTLLTPLVAGAGVVLNQRFHTEKFFERINIEKVHVVSVVPTILQFLLHARIEPEAYKLAHFRHIICGAGPLTVELASRFEQEFRIPIIHGYGLSETTCYSCFLPIDLTREEHGHWLTAHGFPSIGVPLPVNEMAIHGEDGSERGEGERGEIVIRGHNVMKEYDQNPAANEQAFTHGWFRSGDEGFYREDDQGRRFFFITGRIKELIIRGGVNISPFEIDEVLMSIPGVQTGIAVGFDNDWYGEEVGAYVKLKEDAALTEEHVLAQCRKVLPFSKTPKVVVFADEVPVTSTGKYQRTKCRPHFTQWKETQFHEKQ
jgi:long-chain acyl-CoA synthetase